MRGCNDDVVVLGAGLAGLAAAHSLAGARHKVRVIEREPVVGGLARTVTRGPFRFDLGGHRLFTDDPALDRWIRNLLGPEGLIVPRRSRILLRGSYIEYPLRPLDAMSGLGLGTALRIVLDHAARTLARRSGRRRIVSLEDWVVDKFGRTLFDIYFKDYSEKVWGIGCERISAEWVARRIQGLSLGTALRNAFFRSRGAAARTLTDRFLYPAQGIGALPERLRRDVERENEVVCGVEAVRLRHEGSRVRAVGVREGARAFDVDGSAFVSTVPLNELVRMLDPRPPAEVLEAAARLAFRDLAVIAIMLDRARATDQSWIYFPERRIPFGRIHEPTNWSAAMAPEGKTLLVAEQFCFRGDPTWAASDASLAARAVESLAELGLASRREVLDAAVVRVPNAYPLFEVGFERNRETVLAYLRRFENLFPAGRGGTFSYLNMDHALSAGLDAARRILARESGEDEEAAILARRSA